MGKKTVLPLSTFALEPLACASGSGGIDLLATAKQCDQGNQELQYTDQDGYFFHGETAFLPVGEGNESRKTETNYRNADNRFPAPPSALDSLGETWDNSNQLRTLIMPRQEMFFEQTTGGRRVEVLKTYDQSYAREVFKGISEEARQALAAALELEKNFEPADIPDPYGSDYDDFLWDELLEAAREDVRSGPNLYSFFVVAETKAGKAADLYISPDWPSAEVYAKGRLASN